MKKILMSMFCLGLAATVMLASCEKNDETKKDETKENLNVEQEDNQIEIVVPEEQLDYEVSINSFNLTAAITEYKGSAEDVVVPATVVDPIYGDVCPVVAIDDSAFLGNETLKSVTLPESVTEIAEGAFQNCSSLTKVTLPEGLETIGSKAFYNTALEEINIPSTVSQIGMFAFSTQLNETPWYASLKDELVVVGDGILLKYNGTGDVTLGSDVKHIAYYAFSAPGAITVTLEGDLESIDSAAVFEASGKYDIVFSVPYESEAKELIDSTIFMCEEYGAPEVETEVVEGEAAFEEATEEATEETVVEAE